MSAPIQITGFFTPNDYVDRAMEHLLPQEYVVLSFAARHILGWRDKLNERAAPISLEMFEHGFAYTDKQTGERRRFGGCGLARPTISKCLQALETFGLLERAGYQQDKGQMWRIGQFPKWELLEDRTKQRLEANRKRTSKARAKRGSNVALSFEGEIALAETSDDGGSNVALYDGSNVAHYDGRIVAQTESNTSTKTSTNTNISGTEQQPPTDTPITNPISDGNDTVATRSAEHTPVTAAARDTDHTPSRESVEKQAETAPPESSAKAPPAEPSPACTPTREQRDAMFEAVCGHIFGVVGKDNIREMARSEHSRAGKIVSWLLKQSDGFAPNGSKKAARVVVGWISAPAQPEHVEKFAAQYKQKHRDASLPLDIVKFTDAWRAWGSELARESRRKAARAQQAEARQAERPQVTPEQRAAMKAQLQAARNSLKAERTDA